MAMKRKAFNFKL